MALHDELVEADAIKPGAVSARLRTFRADKPGLRALIEELANQFEQRPFRDAGPPAKPALGVIDGDKHD